MDPQQMAIVGDPDWSKDQPDEDEDRVNSQTSEEEDDEQRAASDGNQPDEDLPSRDELLNAYTQAKQIIEEKAREADNLRNRMEAVGAEARATREKVEYEAFMREFHESFQKDPARATALFVQQAHADVANEMEARLAQAFRDQRNFQRFMTIFLEDPANANLRPYRDELETMILYKGLSPTDAAEIIRTIETHRDDNLRKRSAAAREVRARAVVESGEHASEPSDKDKEFDKVLKKAKTLDEMFAGLRKLRL